MKQILFLAVYPENSAPSQRFRVEQFLDDWRELGFEVKIIPFYDEATYEILYLKGRLARKIWAITKAFVRRTITILTVPKKYDLVFVQRGITPIGPPFFEWFITKVINKPLVFDFDDAIWMDDNQASKIKKLVKSHWKVAKICRWASEVLVGNEFLAKYASQYNSNVKVIPTVIDTERRYKPLFRNEKEEHKRIVIGWTGSHSTMPYLEIVLPHLRALGEHYDFEFLVISNRAPAFIFENMRFLPWNSKSEITDLAQMDIGLMPLLSDEWAKGKCGFKAIQYMGLGIPAVVSAVGVNSKIVDHRVNGYLVEGDGQDWYRFLEELLISQKKREEMGEAARAKIEEYYSIKSQLGHYKGVFNSILEAS